MARCLRVRVGDRVTLHWSDAHNLHELLTEADYSSCSFGSAELLASAGSNRAGLTVGPFARAEDRFFACSKICRSQDHKLRVCVLSPVDYVAGGSCPCTEGRLTEP